MNTGPQKSCTRGDDPIVNLCRPDSRKSCAACCGLYNVPDATRPALYAKLERRTRAFRQVDRTPQAIDDYQNWVRASESARPLDNVIHVCEFTGFLDPLQRVVGCQLHPTAPGNEGLDLRGLCHYGSMACKGFFCPAWEAIPPRVGNMVCLLVDDWHLYGLVMTDVDFVQALFSLLEHRVGTELNLSILQRGEAASILREMLSWKDTWPFGTASLLRRSRYYFKETRIESADAMGCLLDSLRFTFGDDEHGDNARGFVQETIERFARAYVNVENEGVPQRVRTR